MPKIILIGSNRPDVLTPEEAKLALELAEGKYRPKQILELQTEIEKAQKAAAADTMKKGRIDPGRILEIVEMRFELDRLYVAYVRSKTK